MVAEQAENPVRKRRLREYVAIGVLVACACIAELLGIAL